MCTSNGALRSIRTLRPLPRVKKTIFETRGLALPLGFLTAIETRSFPPAGVQRRPVCRFTAPSGSGTVAGGGGGADGFSGRAIGPRSTHGVQTPVHCL